MVTNSNQLETVILKTSLPNLKAYDSMLANIMCKCNMYIICDDH